MNELEKEFATKELMNNVYDLIKVEPYKVISAISDSIKYHRERFENESNFLYIKCMQNKVFVLSLFLLSLVMQNCNSVDSSGINAGSVMQTPTPQTLIATEKKVEFKGVNFTYNPQILGEVKSEEIADYPLEEETFKPDFVEPQHRLFTFDLPTEYSPMQIAVYSVNDFPGMYAVNKSSVKMMEEEISNLKNVLKNKDFRDDNKQIAFLPFRDAEQSFQVKVKHFPFSGGQGILFLTFWNTEVELPSNRQLRFIFEGLTNDGKYYVLAEMPTKVDFLSDESAQEFEGYKIPWGKLDDKLEMKHFADVIKKIGERLDELPQNKFQPNLNELEKIISTLKIEK